MDKINLQILCVDLDGTLVKTDTLHESLILLLKKNFLYLAVFPFWLVKGKAHFKEQVAKRIVPDAKHLPYNPVVLEYINKRNQEGIKSFLVTASHQSVADVIANHLGLFSAAYGSNQEKNYKGTAKASFLDEKFGRGKYEYIGNDSSDLPVWAHSGRAVVSSSNKRLLSKASASCEDTVHLDNGMRRNLYSYLKMMRIHQWVKNVLIFLPLVLSHSITDFDKAMDSFYGFVLFSFAASGIYIFNDLIDLAHDRAHPTKARRQLASGEIPVLHGVFLGFVLWSVSLVTSFIYFENLFLLIIGYIILNFLYSSILKKLVLIDVLVLAGFYTLRIIIGAVMAGVSMSYWLLTFSLFVFFSLALVKRYSEIALHTEENSGVKGRGYHSEDKLITTILGVASGLMSILVMALYINDPHTRELYSHAAWLWVTIPALLYWMSRLWLLAHRKMITDDPMLFALKDTESYLTAAVLAFGFYMAI